MNLSGKTTVSTKASSINRALDEIGDKWCLLILQEVFWGINTFSDMLAGTGASRGVLSNRLSWLQSVGCLRKDITVKGQKRPTYHMTKKSIELYRNGLMAMTWERKYFTTPALDSVELIHDRCGKAFWPMMECSHCDQSVLSTDVSFHKGPGAKNDTRITKTRRRSSNLSASEDRGKTLYNNLINLLGDRWTANIIALAFHGFNRFDDFHTELPVATNILADRLKLLVNEGIFYQQPYQVSPLRYDYHLTDKGRDLFPYFVTLMAWGDKWCTTGDGNPILLKHISCGADLNAEVRCDQCGEGLIATEVHFKR
jgi:DNA-binding HxlR family transcriptional regulator|tara:strand:- start:67 stop:1002 length:936 start_codon:yes stop_codon:yes gene_type:complete